LWDSAIKAAEGLGVDEPILPRKRKIPTRFDSENRSFYPNSPEDHYRMLYLETFDAVITGFATRFEPTETSNHLQTIKYQVQTWARVSKVREQIYIIFTYFFVNNYFR
jgi:hypothetical protein